MGLNLHAIVRRAINSVNPDVIGTLYRNTGYVTAANGEQTPQYQRVDGVTIQVQPVSTKEIEHTDNLSIQGVLRGLWLNTPVSAINRAKRAGGDVVHLPDGTKWLIVLVVEAWDSAGWYHAVGQQQL